MNQEGLTDPCVRSLRLSAADTCVPRGRRYSGGTAGQGCAVVLHVWQKWARGSSARRLDELRKIVREHLINLADLEVLHSAISARTTDGKPPDAVPRVLNENQCARFKFSEAFGKHCREALIHRIRSLIGQSEEDHARFVENATRENIAEIGVKCDDDTGIVTRAVNQEGIGSAL